TQRAESGRFDYMHHLHLTTAEANPAIDAEWLEDRRREDLDTYGREYEARWLDGAGSYLSSAEVVAAVRRAPRNGFLRRRRPASQKRRSGPAASSSAA